MAFISLRQAHTLDGLLVEDSTSLPLITAIAIMTVIIHNLFLVKSNSIICN